MREFLERHRVTIASFAALVVPLFLLYVHGRSPRNTTVVEYALLRLTSPVELAASHMLEGVADVWSGYVALVDLEQENEKLQREVQVLTGEALRAKELEYENQRLRELLEFKRGRKALETVASHVIGQDVSPYARVVRIAIDVGEEDGVREGMPVVAAEGLVGRVKQVAGRYAEVMLTVDARSSVNVRVAGKGVTGSLEGTGAADAYMARLLYLNKAEPLEVGDTLVTSGHDKVFPPGIEVGYIRSLEERQRGLYYELQVAPAVNFSTLEEVMVVVGASAEEPVAEGADDAGEEGSP
ncbi:MAG: rod shape-determining protein MreC [Myxococcota bacterium]